MALIDSNYSPQSQNCVFVPSPQFAWLNAKDIGDLAAEVLGKLW